MVTMSFQSRYKINGKKNTTIFSNVILILIFNFVHYNLLNRTKLYIQPLKLWYNIYTCI